MTFSNSSTLFLIVPKRQKGAGAAEMCRGLIFSCSISQKLLLWKKTRLKDYGSVF